MAKALLQTGKHKVTAITRADSKSVMPEGAVVMCHPGFVDQELRDLDPLTTLREREYAFFVSEAFPALLARHGVALA